MSYRFRNILFFSFVGVFIILTTIFSLYASGYRLSVDSFLKGQMPVQKTGILILDSTPKGAKVVLERQFRGLFFDNNVLKNKVIKTPYKIKNLLPGEYLLRLEMDGYWTFEQKINIYPGQSTYLEDIVLFQKNLPALFYPSASQKISLDPNYQKVLLENDKTLVDLEDEQTDKLMDQVTSAEFIGAQKMLLNGGIIFDYSKKKYIDWPENVKAIYSKVKVRNKDLYYIKDDRELKMSGLSKEEPKTIFSRSKIIDFEFYNNFYYLVEKNENVYSLKAYYYKNQELYREFILPASDSYEILPLTGSSPFVYIYNKDWNNIYVINLSSRLNSVWATIEGVKGFNFIDNNSLVYFTDFEIFTFNSVLADKSLVTRLENKITSVVWHPNNYIIYSTQNSLTVFDLKYEKNSVNLVALDAISNLVLDRLGGVLYFSGKIGSQEGLFKLLIK